MDLEYGPEYQEFTKEVQSFCKKYEGLVIIVWTEFAGIFFKTLSVSPQIILFSNVFFTYFFDLLSLRIINCLYHQ